MKKRTKSSLLRILAAVFLFFSMFDVCITVQNAGHSIVEYGNKMANIRSVGGNSIAESYYQNQGIIYASLGVVIEQCAGLILIAAIALVVLILYPVFVKKQIVCSNCKNTIPEGTTFCVYCGNKIGE